MTIQANTETTLPVSDATKAFLSSRHALLIGAKDALAQSGREIAVHDPASGAVIARVPAGDKLEIDAAVMAARKALEGPWSRLRPTERERLLLKLADAVETDGRLLAEVETANNGQSINLAQAIEVGAAAEHL